MPAKPPMRNLSSGRCSIPVCGSPSYAACHQATSSGSRDHCASAEKVAPTASDQRKGLYRCHAGQALLEPYFSLNDKWFIGRRQVQKVVQRVAERARISQEVTPHVLRHTFATLAIQMAAIQKILGHDRLGTTAIYLNLTDTHVVDEYSQKW